MEDGEKRITKRTRRHEEEKTDKGKIIYFITN